jgi:hypothetical protein
VYKTWLRKVPALMDTFSSTFSCTVAEEKEKFLASNKPVQFSSYKNIYSIFGRIHHDAGPDIGKRYSPDHHAGSGDFRVFFCVGGTQCFFQRLYREL